MRMIALKSLCDLRARAFYPHAWHSLFSFLFPHQHLNYLADHWESERALLLSAAA